MNDNYAIGIGGSLGALDVLKVICAGLPPDFPAAIFLVMHLSADSMDRLAAVLGKNTKLPVSTAIDGETVQAGHIYTAPVDRHLLVLNGRICLGRGPRENMTRPAVDPLLRSLGFSFGSRAIGVILTGMLNDGAAGLADLKRCGGLTVAQNPADAAASEMPLAALRASAVDYRAPAEALAPLLVSLVRRSPGMAPEAPVDIGLEIEIALGNPMDTHKTELIADPIAMVCPDCGGVLSQIRQWPPLRFRCQVGHAYSAEILLREKEGAVDEAVRVALRIIEERVVLIEAMAGDAERQDRPGMAALYRKRVAELRSYAEVLRKAALSTRGPTQEP